MTKYVFLVQEVVGCGVHEWLIQPVVVFFCVQEIFEKKDVYQNIRSVLYRLHTKGLYHGSSTQKSFKDPPKHVLHA